MSKFHSTVTRRDFMKGLGLAGAGLGAAAAAAPVFHDLDEVGASFTTSPWANYSRPWWLKEREFENPTTELDWSILQPWDWGYEPSNTVIYNPFFGAFGGTEYGVQESGVFRNFKNSEMARIRDEGLKAGTPGYALRDVAMSTGARFFSDPGLRLPVWDPFGGGVVTTPEERGVSKWTGTPEEATNMLRAAAHVFGSPNMGAIELTANIKKLYYPKSTRFEDVDIAYLDGQTGVTPTKCRWALCFVVRQNDEMNRRGITSQNLGSGATGYFYYPIILHRMERFIKSLGYQALRGGMNVPLGIMCGLGELGRLNMQMTPEWGPAIRETPVLTTDLPLAPTKPIDAGMWKFCIACKLCSTACREMWGDSPITLDDEPSYEVTGPWNRVGVKKYQHNWPMCTHCVLCMPACPFSHKSDAIIHDVVKAAVATNPVLNSFFTTMEGVFGYHWERSEEVRAQWWERDLNTWPYDCIFF